MKNILLFIGLLVLFVGIGLIINIGGAFIDWATFVNDLSFKR